MKPHEQTALNRIAKTLTGPLSRVVASPVTAEAASLAEAYLCILLGKGAGTGWALDSEVRAAQSFIRHQSPVLFDVGANSGEWASGMQQAYPQARMFLFEPQLTCQSLILEKRLPQSVLITKAVSSAAGSPVKLYTSGGADGGASLHPRRDSYFGDRTFTPIEVDTTTIDQVICEHHLDGVDFMKMDIEGHELDALKGAQEALRHGIIKALSFEFGSGNINSRTFFHDFWDLLTPLGYRIYRILPSSRLLAITNYYEDCEYFRGATNYIAARITPARRARLGMATTYEQVLSKSRPLRLVHHVAGDIGPDALGIGRAVYHLAHAQRALGHEVGLVSEGAEHIDERQRRAERSPLTARTRLARRMPWVAPTVVREVLGNRPDIVHLHSIHVLENISLARHLRAARVPYCVTIHGGLHNRRRGRMKKSALWWLGERQYLNNALFIHALTCEEAKDIGAYGVAAPIVIAPNGIDVGALPRIGNPAALVARAPELAGHRVFMYMGRVAPIQKGLDLLLQALALANLPGARLVILGPDFRGGRAAVESLADRLGVRSQVTFLDREPPQRCADLIAGADVFVHTSRWEGMSLAVLEAAGWEKPCLLTPAADPNGALGQAGAAVVVDGTPEAIAAGLRVMAGLGRDALLTMGQRAHDTVVTQFTWSRGAATLIEAYRHGCGSDRR